MNTEQERADFEAWAQNSFELHRNSAGEYSSNFAQTAWWAWQARAAIEADRKRRGEPTAAEISDVIREITGCPDIKNGEDSLVVALGMLFHRGATPQPAEPDKQHPDDVAVDAFAAAMKAKLKRAREEKGRGGWQDMSATELSAMLREHVEKGDPVDVANLAMMLSLNGQRIAPDEPVKVPSDDLAHEIWAAAQTAPWEGIEDAVERIAALLDRYGKGTP